ncbi:PPC domain-containing DNA-binding protein [Thermoplasma sp.]|uniref:PPC domain-containing DNA-binding protein n=1 Tax=Thermoplasma sp. TaxID=1973142 RepID=UPI001286B573|nr:PPC domain-containing DNA-binding protein [Thermoplasma sp.]KAA8923131.1 MAG: DNA-binding protein [Thermoplasma sp.]
MYSKMEGNFIVARFDKNTSFFDDLEEVCRKYNVKAGTVVWAIGMLKNFEVGYWNGQDYEKETFRERLEVVSLHGTIAENEPRYHIHASGARSNHMIVGGHLFSAIVDPLIEIQIMNVTGSKMTRVQDPSDKLYKLTIE